MPGTGRVLFGHVQQLTVLQPCGFSQVEHREQPGPFRHVTCQAHDVGAEDVSATAVPV
jgi:hypothetical protein